MVNRETEYDLRPYITNAGTGKLFRSPKNTIPDRARFPRGFTPDRIHEVSEAVGDVSLTLGEGIRATHDPEVYKSLNPVATVSPQGTVEDTPGVGTSTNQQRKDLGRGAAVIRESLARSTAPVEAIENAKSFSVSPGLPYNGVFMPGERRLHFGFRSDQLDFYREHEIPEEESLGGKTVIHELGHANDARMAKTNPANPDGVRNDILWAEAPAGALEEFADDFAEEHYRPDPRGRTYGATNSYPGRRPGWQNAMEGYEKWGQRSAMAAQEIRGRLEKNPNAPTTPEQRDYIQNEFLDAPLLQQGQFGGDEWIQPAMIEDDPMLPGGGTPRRPAIRRDLT